MSDIALYHYGIKGMKWGVRRYQNKDGTYTAAGKKRREKSISPREEAKSLSDDELRKRINRMNMEKQYVNLINERNVSKGKQFMKKAAKAGATAATISSTALTLYSNSERIGKIVDNMLKKR